MSDIDTFKTVSPADFVGTCAAGINPDWMLLCAGAAGQAPAAMTVSFGAFGFIWGKHLALCVVRHSRHTLPFILDNNSFSLAFFDQSWRDKLLWCGRNSGRDVDKVAHCGFTVLYDDNVPFFAQSSSVLICKLMYKDDIKKSGFVDPAIYDEWYGHGVHKDDMHTVLYAAIEKVLVKE